MNDYQIQIVKFNNTQPHQKKFYINIYYSKLDQVFNNNEYEVYIGFRIDTQFENEQYFYRIVEYKDLFIYKIQQFKVCDVDYYYYNKEKDKCIRKVDVKIIIIQQRDPQYLTLYAETLESRYFEEYFLKEWRDLLISNFVQNVDYKWTIKLSQKYYTMLKYSIFIEPARTIYGRRLTVFKTYTTRFFQQTVDYRLIVRQLDFRCNDIYMVDEDTKKMVQEAVESFLAAQYTSYSLSFMANFITGGSIIVSQVMMISGLINVFGYISLIQPYNMMKMYNYKREEPEVLYNPNWLENIDQLKLVPDHFTRYDISPMFLNNYAEKLQKVVLILIVGLVMKKFRDKINTMKNIYLRTVMQFTFQMFCFNYPIFYFFENISLCFMNVLLVINYTFTSQAMSVQLLLNNIVALLVFVVICLTVFHLYYTGRTCLKELQIYVELLIMKQQQDKLDNVKYKLNIKKRKEENIRKKHETKKLIKMKNQDQQQQIGYEKSENQNKEDQDLNPLEMFGNEYVTEEKIEDLKVKLQKFYVIKKIDKFYQVKEENRMQYLAQYEILHKDYRKTKMIYSFYYLVDIGRIGLFVIIVIQLQNYPLWACVLILILEVVYILQYVRYSPYNHPIKNFFAIMIEMFMTIVVICITFIVYQDYVLVFDNFKMRMDLGYSVLFSSQLLMYVACIINIYMIGSQLIIIVKAYKLEKKKVFVKEKNEAISIIDIKQQNADIDILREIVILKLEQGKIKFDDIVKNKKQLQIDDQRLKKIMYHIKMKRLKEIQRLNKKSKMRLEDIVIEGQEEVDNFGSFNSQSQNNRSDSGSVNSQSDSGGSDQILESQNIDQHQQKVNDFKVDQKKNVNESVEDMNTHNNVDHKDDIHIDMQKLDQSFNEQTIYETEIIDEIQNQSIKKNTKSKKVKSKNNSKTNSRINSKLNRSNNSRINTNNQLNKSQSSFMQSKESSFISPADQEKARLIEKQNQEMEIKKRKEEKLKQQKVEQHKMLLQSKLDQQTKDNLGASNINNTKRQIQLLEQKKEMGLDHISDNEFEAILNNPTILKSIVKQHKMLKAMNK